MNGEPLRPVPKPVRAERAPKRLRAVSAKRAARIAAGEERAGLARTTRLKARGNTAYANRERETGKMLFVRSTLPCAARVVPGIDPCRGDRQFSHLGDRRTNGGFRKCPDGEGGSMCAHHHQQVDNPLGFTGHEGFYLALPVAARVAFRVGAMAAADEAWNSLTDEQRAFWDDKAAMQAARGRRAQ